jgi:phosphate transport system substrate-binding protein
MSATNPSEAPTPPASPTTPASPASTPVVKRRSGQTGVWVAVGVVVVVAIVVGVGFGTSWYGLQKSSTSTKYCGTGVTLQGNGAQFVNPLLTNWVTTYHSTTGGLVNWVDGGSGTGLTDFSEHPPLEDFAITDDPLTAAEASAMPSQALTLPFVGGALAIIYNVAGVTGHLNLTGAVLAGIYNGTITTWNNPALTALNPGLKNTSATIVPVVRSDSAGTTYVLTNFLSDESAWWASHVGKGISVKFPPIAAEQAVKGNSLVISTVAKTSDSIGYSDLTDVLTYPTPLQYAAIQNPKTNFIVPTIANTASAIADQVGNLTSIPASTDAKDWFNISMVNAPGTTDYPLATLVYMFVYQNTTAGFTPSLERSQNLVQWLHYVLSSTAQAMADETSPSQLYYTALPAAIISVDEAGIQTMTFNGAGIPACT